MYHRQQSSFTSNCGLACWPRWGRPDRLTTSYTAIWALNSTDRSQTASLAISNMAGCLRHIRNCNELSRSNFGLQHDQPDQFYKSQVGDILTFDFITKIDVCQFFTLWSFVHVSLIFNAYIYIYSFYFEFLLSRQIQSLVLTAFRLRGRGNLTHLSQGNRIHIHM